MHSHLHSDFHGSGSLSPSQTPAPAEEVKAIRGPFKLPPLGQEQSLLDAVLREAVRLDGSIKDFLIHEDDVIRVACARGTKTLTELFDADTENTRALIDKPISRKEILHFVVVNVMGASPTNEKVVKERVDFLGDELRSKKSYSDSIRLNWGYKIRIMLFRQSKAKLAIVGRVSSLVVPSIDRLGLPPAAVLSIRQAQRGLILLTGPMSSGKTSTAQAILSYLNKSVAGHIVTIEDPIETEIESEKCLITRKEVGIDVDSFHHGLRDALRQAADTIFIGELRDADTIKTVISAAGSGVLVIATVHGDTCTGALTRMMSMLGDEAEGYWRLLAQSLTCVVRQALVPQANGVGWFVVADALMNKGQVNSALTKRDVATLESYIAGGSKGDEWVSMNDTLRGLVVSKKITQEAAKKATTNQRLLVQG